MESPYAPASQQTHVHHARTYALLLTAACGGGFGAPSEDKVGHGGSRGHPTAWERCWEERGSCQDALTWSSLGVFALGMLSHLALPDGACRGGDQAPGVGPATLPSPPALPISPVSPGNVLQTSPRILKIPSSQVTMGWLPKPHSLNTQAAMNLGCPGLAGPSTVGIC